MSKRVLSPIRHLAAVLVATALFGAGPAPASTLSHSARPAIFGSVAVESHNIGLFPKWTWMLRRYLREEPRETAPCVPTSDPRSCSLQRWRHFLAGIKGMSHIEQLRSVNRFANFAPYVTDPVNYHVPDYWATPLQFLTLDGDCEDYAITKYLSLRALGFADSDLRIVVLEDMNLRIAHAILVVYLNGVAWVLDNQVAEVVRADAIHHYRPIYSLNETAWWLHRSQARPDYQAAQR
jgi:predicted transglutaminase-like cysteine proteinase